MGDSAPPDDEPSDRRLEAELRPSRGVGDGTADVTIDVYVVTGRHGVLTVPESFCRECDLFVRAADVAADRADAEVTVSVRSWWTHFIHALRYGGYHPPVMVVGGKRLCQGHHVPTTEEVEAAIEDALDRSRGTEPEAGTSRA